MLIYIAIFPHSGEGNISIAETPYPENIMPMCQKFYA
jgi:hypothetical protein